MVMEENMGRPRKSEEEKGVVTWSRLPPAVRRKLKARCTAPLAGPSTLSAVIRAALEEDVRRDELDLAKIADDEASAWVMEHTRLALDTGVYKELVRSFMRAMRLVAKP